MEKMNEEVKGVVFEDEVKEGRKDGFVVMVDVGGVGKKGVKGRLVCGSSSKYGSCIFQSGYCGREIRRLVRGGIEKVEVKIGSGKGEGRDGGDVMESSKSDCKSKARKYLMECKEGKWLVKKEGDKVFLKWNGEGNYEVLELEK